MHFKELSRSIIVGLRDSFPDFRSSRPISISKRTAKPCVSYPDIAKPLEVDQFRIPFNLCYINEPGKLSFGVKDYAPGVFIPLHHHHTWELIVIDFISEGPGYILFDGAWWRADPGTAVFIPRGYPNAWSAGRKSFRMLWLYGGCLEEAGRVIDADPATMHAITLEEERTALPPERWTNPNMFQWHTGEDRFWTE